MHRDATFGTHPYHLHCVVDPPPLLKGTNTLMKLRHLAIIATVGTLGLAACGSDAEEGTPSTEAAATSDAAATVPAGADFNTADVEFAQGMIPHHEQAIEMADIALDPTVEAGEQVRDLATRIKGAQDPEIELMTGWLTAWGQPMQMDTSEGHDMSTMDGMMTAEEMDSLGTMKGAEFDTKWMETMTRHHEGAIAMAETEKASGANPEALAVADQIIAAQQAEISEMQALLGA